MTALCVCQKELFLCDQCFKKQNLCQRGLEFLYTKMFLYIKQTWLGQAH